MGADHPVVLVGPMAVGKSAVGRMLAQRRGARFVDTDRVIVKRHGSIAGIFARDGEQAFRSLEAEVVRDALAEDGVVISLGGGAVLHPGTRELLAEATVVFLDTDLATVLPRIRADSSRPLLAGRPAERWQELYDARRPVYVAVASAVVDTRGLTVREATEAVLHALAAHPNDHRHDESGNSHGH
ncbi:shikimate kinase [Arthrobacter sp. MDT2-16]